MPVDLTAMTDHQEQWDQLLASRSDLAPSGLGRLAAIFDPLRPASPEGMVIVAQLGQSLDGRIATHTGHSKYINGQAGLEHLHRLRAWVDAVVVGVGTVVADDPLLTVRMVSGQHPVRVVIDPLGRVPQSAKIFSDDGVQTLIVTSLSSHWACSTSNPNPRIEAIVLPAIDKKIPPSDILSALAKRGLRRILIEGGAHTISSFMQAGCLNRVHVIVAPIILGSGRSGFELPLIDKVDQALRPMVTTHLLTDGEVLFDCAFKPAN